MFNGKSELKAAAAMAKVSSAVKDGITAIVDTDKEMREELKTMLEPIQKEMQEALEKAKAYDEKMTPIKEKLNADAKAVKDNTMRLAGCDVNAQKKNLGSRRYT